MLQTNTWIYLTVQKTGSTFLSKKLIEIYGQAAFSKDRKHGLQKKSTSKSKIITIRDPFDYYFSLWSYGLDGKGGFSNKLRISNPSLAEKIYGKKTKSCFSHFLDLALSFPGRNSQSEVSWLPRSTDLYTARILTMLVPQDKIERFSSELDCDFSGKSIAKSLNELLPEVIIRTEYLNYDFHYLASAGELDFMELPTNWSQIFVKDAARLNSSSSHEVDGKKLKQHELLSEYHKNLIELKCTTAKYLIQTANERIKELESRV